MTLAAYSGQWRGTAIDGQPILPHLTPKAPITSTRARSSSVGSPHARRRSARKQDHDRDASGPSPQPRAAIGFASIHRHLWIRPAFSRSGGLSTLCLIDAERSFRVPEEVPSELAALTEPLAVGLHAAHLANRNTGPNLVIGCGPVGLAVIAALLRQGKRPIISAFFSTRRRAAAEVLGCDIVIDPAQESAFERWDDLGFTARAASPLLERSFRGLPPAPTFRLCRQAGPDRHDYQVGAPALPCDRCRGLRP